MSGDDKGGGELTSLGSISSLSVASFLTIATLWEKRQVEIVSCRDRGGEGGKVGEGGELEGGR